MVGMDSGAAIMNLADLDFIGKPRRRRAADLRAVIVNQPTHSAEIESLFPTADPESLAIAVDLDKGDGSMAERTVTVARERDWLAGERRFPGERQIGGKYRQRKIN